MHLSTVNKKLKELGYSEQLVRGDSYFYFIGGDTENWQQTSVYVSALNQLSLDQWIEDFKHLKAEQTVNQLHSKGN